ncbi:MAG: beta-N-acetylhexosaminidase [Betaproteobacteria bacterium]|nr:beta-N-acetylhexosaminidase [Betaproteobacteria bacterium]
MQRRPPLGRVILDVEGLELNVDDRRRLSHPLVGGVILFARNYQDPQQLRALTASIRALRSPELIIAVDHEGGRVQRFRRGFYPLPPMRRLGELWLSDRGAARAMARSAGNIIALELTAHGVDFSFAPVLDLDYGNNMVIGDRAFSANPECVTDLAAALIDGLHAQGVIAVGKHFPGHGYCAGDSHVDIPHDNRTLHDIEAADLRPFAALLKDHLDALMPAHVIYDQVDPLPAGFSPFWLQTQLRGRYGFRGIIFSDDLSMEGASVAGGPVQRAHSALAAGCDMVLLCNQPAKADELLTGLVYEPDPRWEVRIESMRARPSVTTPEALASLPAYQVARETLSALV